MMPLLLLTAVLAGSGASESPHRLDVGASFAYGYGSQQAFGGFVEGMYGLQVWETAHAGGTLEGGLLLGYQAQPHGIYAPILGGAEISGANHVLETWLVLGHGLRLPPSRRALLSLQLFGGWTHLFVRGGLRNEALGVSGAAKADAGRFTGGLMLQLGVRVTELVSVNARFIAPLPYSMEVNSWFLGTLGVSVRVP